MNTQDVAAVEVFVGMGSNIEPRVHVPDALAGLRAAFGILDVSPVYRCPAVGFSGNDFVNLVVAFQSSDAVEDVQAQLRGIEAACGRHRGAGDGSRTMDLDMLLFGQAIFDNGDIRVPRSDIVEYAFVLRPLAQMRPTGQHPVLGQTYGELWAAFDDSDQPLTQIEI